VGLIAGGLHKDSEPEYCFLVTDEILQGISTFIRSRESQNQLSLTETAALTALRTEMKFKVFFSTHFLGEFKPLDRDIQEHIIERSKVRGAVRTR